eukprot:149812_1
MSSRNQPQRGMSHLKARIEASNALQNATDETVNSCFTQIINEIFGGKRNLLQSLLSPQLNLKQQQMEQMKRILHTEPDTDMIDSDAQACTATLISIAESTQVLITSFLDFESINQLKNVCSSIAPICMEQLLTKMDIKILNVHELIRNQSISDDNIKMNAIIQSSLHSHRVHRAHTLKSLVQKETTIAFDNLLCFKYPLSKYPGVRLRMMVDIVGNRLITMRDLNASVLLFIDKALLPFTFTYEPWTFVKEFEFDINHQSLRLGRVIPPTLQ